MGTREFFHIRGPAVNGAVSQIVRVTRKLQVTPTHDLVSPRHLLLMSSTTNLEGKSAILLQMKRERSTR